MSEETRPLPCPFCGGAAKETEAPRNPMPVYWIQCTSCHAVTQPSLDIDYALAAWNRRWYPPSKPVDEWLNE